MSVPWSFKIAGFVKFWQGRKKIANLGTFFRNFPTRRTVGIFRKIFPRVIKRAQEKFWIYIRSIETINELVEDSLTHCQKSSHEIETTTTTTTTTTTAIDISVDPDLCSSVIYITDGDLEHGQQQLELIKKDAEQFHNCKSCRAALIGVKIIFNKINNHLIKKLVNNFIHKIFTLIFDA